MVQGVGNEKAPDICSRGGTKSALELTKIPAQMRQTNYAGQLVVIRGDDLTKLNSAKLVERSYLRGGG